MKLSPGIIFKFHNKKNKSLPDFRKLNWFALMVKVAYTGSVGCTKIRVSIFWHKERMHRAVRLVVDTGLHAKAVLENKPLNIPLNEAESG
jgi:hypothetical protein